MAGGKENRVQWSYSSRGNRELSERYDQRTQDYDSDLEDDFGWPGPQRAAEVLAAHVPKVARVLDVGGGTGLEIECLAKPGYENMVAMDLSPGVLEEARKKGVYRELHQMTMGGHLDYPTAAFDAAVSIGVLTTGHAPASSLDELARVTRSGGHIVFSLRPDLYETGGFKEKQVELVAQGKWSLVEATDRFQPLPKGEPEVFHQVWVYQVAG